MRQLLPFILAACVMLSGCCVLNQKYVDADEKTYGVISTEYLDYIMRDPELTPFQRKLRARTIKSWRARLDEAKRHLEEDVK